MSAQLWGKDSLGGLDAARAANKLLGEGRLIGVAIVGPDGKVLFRGSDPFKGSTFYTVEGNPPVPFHDLKEGITPHLDKGIFGGLKVPSAAKPMIKMFRAGNIPVGMAMLAALKGDAAVASFKDEVTARLEAMRKEKRALFDDLVKAEKSWDAYKVGMSYAKCFPKAPDLAEVKDALKAVQGSPAVKSNLTSKGAYSQLASNGFGSRSKPSLADGTSAAMGQMAQKYGETEFGKYAASIAR
jgi:hypothetical protein